MADSERKYVDKKYRHLLNNTILYGSPKYKKLPKNVVYVHMIGIILLEGNISSSNRRLSIPICKILLIDLFSFSLCCTNNYLSCRNINQFKSIKSNLKNNSDLLLVLLREYSKSSLVDWTGFFCWIFCIVE